MSDNSNTAIWDRAFKTDPKFTKSFTRTGGFKGTAINPTWMASRATAEFGPCGTGWGVQVLGEELIEGHPVYSKDGVKEGNVKVHKVHISLWYKIPGVVSDAPTDGFNSEPRSSIEAFGQTEMVGVNKYGWYTDEEAPKKSLTDAMTKALSLLGFGGDVHMGLYDDSKYVADLKSAPVSTAAPAPKGSATDRAGIVDMWRAAIAKAASQEALNALRERMNKLPLEVQLELSPGWEARRADVMAGPV